jgi:hypothetical protein
MSTPHGDHPVLRELDITVRAELTLAETSQPEEEAEVVPDAEWTDPDLERYEIALRTLLGAVEALEDDSGGQPPQAGPRPDTETGGR